MGLASRQLRMDAVSGSIKSPMTGGFSPRVNPLSPTKEATTSFKFPGEESATQHPTIQRRDSLFERPESHANLLSKLHRIGTDRDTKTPPVKELPKEAAPVEGVGEAKRPSPVKFTSERPEQFPIKPEPERPIGAEDNRQKILSLESLKDALPDLGKEEV
jgi:hypothetical protein